MRRKYGAAIAGAVLALQLPGQPAAQEGAPALIELQTISALLDANDVDGLRSYLQLNPALLEGDSDLANLLRQYVDQSDDLPGFLSVSPLAGQADADDSDGPTRASGGGTVTSSPDAPATIY